VDMKKKVDMSDEEWNQRHKTQNLIIGQHVVKFYRTLWKKFEKVQKKVLNPHDWVLDVGWTLCDYWLQSSAKQENPDVAKIHRMIPTFLFVGFLDALRERGIDIEGLFKEYMEKKTNKKITILEENPDAD